MLCKTFNLVSVAMSLVNPEETIPYDLFEKLWTIKLQKVFINPPHVLKGQIVWSAINTVRRKIYINLVC